MPRSALVRDRRPRFAYWPLPGAQEPRTSWRARVALRFRRPLTPPSLDTSACGRPTPSFCRQTRSSPSREAAVANGQAGDGRILGRLRGTFRPIIAELIDQAAPLEERSPLAVRSGARTGNGLKGRVLP